MLCFYAFVQSKEITHSMLKKSLSNGKPPILQKGTTIPSAQLYVYMLCWLKLQMEDNNLTTDLEKTSSHIEMVHVTANMILFSTYFCLNCNGARNLM